MLRSAMTTHSDLDKFGSNIFHATRLPRREVEGKNVGTNSHFNASRLLNDRGRCGLQQCRPPPKLPQHLALLLGMEFARGAGINSLQM